MSIKIVPPGQVATLAPQASGTAYGLATSPSGGTALASIVAPPAGTYQITVEYYLSGTVTGTDGDNIQVTINGVQKLQCLVPPTAAGATGPQSMTFTGVVATGNIAVSAIVAGGAACQYHVSLIATRIA